MTDLSQIIVPIVYPLSDELVFVLLVKSTPYMFCGTSWDL